MVARGSARLGGRDLQRGGEPLWGLGAAAFSSLLRTALRGLGLGELKLTPGSLRAGGATALLEAGVAPSTIRFCGCWASERSMSAYLQEAAAAAAVLDVGPEAITHLKTLLVRYEACRLPPAASSSSLGLSWTPRTRPRY